MSQIGLVMKITSVLALIGAVVAGCTGGASGSGSVNGEALVVPPPRPAVSFEDPASAEAARFLLQTTFGGTEKDVELVVSEGLRPWLRDQFDRPLGQSTLQRFDNHLAASGNNSPQVLTDFFWDNVLNAEDQLRWRMVLALSEIVVLSYNDMEVFNYTRAYAQYIDLLRGEAFGNYCDIVREVTYSPIMGLYLSFYGNRATDPEKGFYPDENYAREVMQLFTIGLEELNLDGTTTGRETYTQEDVAGLAQVFTGLASPDQHFWRTRPSGANQLRKMVGYEKYHEGRRKEFLDHIVNYGAKPERSVNDALDFLLDHPNVAPFISKQLIQKFVTSNPSPDYVRRVAQAFNAGFYDMRDGAVVGTGRRCDLKATMAAILLDPEARDSSYADDPTYGKVRSSALAVAHVLRVLHKDGNVSKSGKIPNAYWLNSRDDYLNQTVFRPFSVFGFYRPQHVPAGTEAAREGLAAPEMQLATVSQGAANRVWMPFLLKSQQPDWVFKQDAERLRTLSHDPSALVAHLDMLMTGSKLEPATRARMVRAVQAVDLEGNPTTIDTRLNQRIQVALAMMMTAPEYMVQR